MAKNATNTEAEAQAVEPVEAPAVVIKLELDEFCSRLSEKVRSPESIAAFHYTERAAGRAQDTEAAYRARFDLFLNTPA